MILDFLCHSIELVPMLDMAMFLALVPRVAIVHMSSRTTLRELHGLRTLTLLPHQLIHKTPQLYSGTLYLSLRIQSWSVALAMVATVEGQCHSLHRTRLV